MTRPRALSGRRGFVLILALWALSFLTVLALAIGLGTRQKIILLGRLEDRSLMHFAAEAGMKKAVAVLMDDIESSQFLFSPASKQRRLSDPSELAGIELGDKEVAVVCGAWDDLAGRQVTRYGFCDEQGKLDLNTTDANTLARLIVFVLGYDVNAAGRLAGDLVDWRDYGHHQAEGFFSDDYYKNLESPYGMKTTPFERIDEMLLVKGVDHDVYAALRPFVTVYGDGHVNINTAPAPVLMALGLDQGLVDRLLKVRRGPDGIEATADDHVFLKTFDIAGEMRALSGLDDKDVRALDALNARNVLTTVSTVYSAVSKVGAGGEAAGAQVEAVFDTMASKYIYWVEK